MPSRSIGWSSTVRIRIKLGPVFIILFHSLRENPEAAFGREYLVGNRSWNTQLYLRPSSQFAPNLQLRSDLLGPFTDSRQAPVPRTSSMFNDACVNAFAVVAEAQTKRFAIGDFRLDMLGLRVVKGIS